MKKLIKAIGFLLLGGLTYLIANIVPSMIVGVIININNAEALGNTESIEAYTALFNELLSPYILPIAIFSGIATIGILALYFLGRKDKMLTYINFKKLPSKDLMLIGLFGVFLNLLFIGAVHYASLILPIDEQMAKYEALMEAAFGTNFIVVFLAVVISAPLFEEIFVRGIVFNDFRKATPTWLALIIQALVFGIMHMNLVQGTYAFFLGLILGIVYLYYKSIWSVIVLHLTFNFTSTMLASFVPGFENYMLPVTFIGVFGSVMMVWLMMKQYDSELYEPSSDLIEPTDDEQISTEISL